VIKRTKSLTTDSHPDSPLPMGLGLDGPWVAQAWRKGGPSVEWRKCFVCNKN
jgi:hypothetical protein